MTQEGPVSWEYFYSVGVTAVLLAKRSRILSSKMAGGGTGANLVLNKLEPSAE